MEIQVTCAGCKKRFKAPERLAGKQVKCPACQEIIEIPSRALTPDVEPLIALDPLTSNDDDGEIGLESPTEDLLAPRYDDSPASLESVSSRSNRPSAGVTRTSTARTLLSPEEILHRRELAKSFEAGFARDEQVESHSTALWPTDKESIPERMRRVKAAFQGEFPLPKVSLLYRIGVAFGALFMAMLPLMYLSLIGGIVWLLFLHASVSGQMFEIARGRAVIWALVLFVAPFLIGGIVIIFLFKPLFTAMRPESGRRRSLTRAGEPIFFAMIDEICDRCRAPRPIRIDVTADVNASARLENGLWSLIGQRKLVLSVGAPLITGLSARQLAGVLAHEFGHFSQSGGMRMTFLMITINRWIARVIYARDEIDDWLCEMWSDEEVDFRIRLFFLLIEGCVRAVRGVFWLLMVVGFFGCGILLRQMEYHADLFESRLAGSKQFSGTSSRMVALDLGWNAALMSNLFHRRQTAKSFNLPEEAAAQADSLSPKDKKALAARMADEKGNLFSSHPPTKLRIKAVELDNSPGILSLDQPARVLFVHYDAITQNVTNDMFKTR